MTLDPGLWVEPETWAAVGQGLATTLRVVGLAAILALSLGMMGAFLLGTAARPAIQGAVLLWRNTPLLVQLYVAYRGLPWLGLTLPAEACGVLGLGLYTGAYLVEVFRAGLESLPAVHREAGLALGMTRWAVFWRLLVPQLVHPLMPPLANQLSSLVKNSALVAFITVDDLFSVVYRGAVDGFRPIEWFSLGAAVYMALVGAVVLGLSLLERAWRRRLEAPR